MKTKPRGRSRFGRSRSIARLRSPDARFERELRRAIRESSPGEAISVHAVECAMGDDCTCVPVVLVVGPRA